MTRLTHKDINMISARLTDHDSYLRSVTGRSLLGIGAVATGIDDVVFLKQVAPAIPMAVVPMRSGLGIISGFADTVTDVLIHLGFAAKTTRHSDVGGFVEAMQTGARVVLAADDDCFAAFCYHQGKVVDNSIATANAFAAGLDLMAGGLVEKRVLILGCGPVGRQTVKALLQRKARITVADRISEKAAGLAEWAKAALGGTIQVARDIEAALMDHDRIIDATNAADVIRTRHITASTLVSAPGMPCGVSPRAMQKLGRRILHDPLQIGVAAMACDAVRIILAKGLPGCHGAWT
jgi:pyrrolysine biosynthesis protein PylD